MFKPDSIIIPSRFCGPKNSGHGGYTAGTLAQYLSGPVEVTIKRPIPMDQKMALVFGLDGVRLEEGAQEVAQAIPREIQLDRIEIPTPSEAKHSKKFSCPEDKHLYPSCFVCGPKRERGDGLRVFPGLVPSKKYACALWTPSADLGDVDGLVKTPFIWSLLDCPAFFGLGLANTYMLTGRISAEIIERPKTGVPYIVSGWRVGQDGRKHFAASAIFDIGQNLIAKSTSTWIEPKKN
ncbi:MAG: hypothetical protein VW557_07665 [Rhodospirillaceae bacterium]